MDHDDTALPIGTLLVDEYRIDGILGTGGFGITYRAHDIRLDVDVAIKEYFPRDFASRSNTVTVRPRSRGESQPFEWGLSQFIEEARRLARLQHPNIVRCMRYFEANETGYFVMTFEEGRTLDAYFPKPPQQAELDALLRPLLDALEALHAGGIYHRDISPDNILVRDDDSPVLIDFGASRQAMARRTQTVAAIVKPGYSPIEQYDRETRLQGAWSDIYSLAATLYCVIAGGPPPEAFSRMRNDAYVPAHDAARGVYRRDFLEAIDWALQPDPDERPVTVREWRRKLLPNPSSTRSVTAVTKLAPHGEQDTKPLAERALGAVGLAKRSSKPATKATAGPNAEQVPQQGLRWPDYVLRGAALAMVAVFAVRLIMSGATTPEEGSAEPLAGIQAGGDAEERSLPALASNAEGVWSKVAFVLRRQGYLQGADPAALADVRSSLKSYQHAIGRPETGTLDADMLNRILDEAVALDPYVVPGAAVHGRWFLEQTAERCAISAGATRIEGRTLVTERPVLRFTRLRAASGDALEMHLPRKDLFDAAAPVTLAAGGDVSTLAEAHVAAEHQVTRALRHHDGEVQMAGTSAYGGPLRLSFPTQGFEAAFRAMAAECGPAILSWIEDWGAVARDSGAVVWSVVGKGSEAEARDAALATCASKSQSGGCESYASFHEQCWALAAGERRKNDWASGWGVGATVDAAKTAALAACAKDGGKGCEFITQICSDGSNEWHASGN